MPKKYRHYGWECSPYSTKTRSYFRYKQIPFDDIHPTAIEIKFIMEKRVGFTIMPVVIAPQGHTLQDSSEIIDAVESAHPARPVFPVPPKQRLISYLFELYGDEWLPIISMTTRWTIPANKAFAFEEFGHCAFPFLPRALTTPLGKKIGAKLNSYLPVLGITEKTKPQIHLWLAELLTQLDTHFSEHPFLLGSQPCLGDFAFHGPLYSHVWRDPASRHLIEAHPHLNAWRERMMHPANVMGSFLDNDEIPPTLWPILQRMFKEQHPVLIKSVQQIQNYLDENPNPKRFPRSLGKVRFQIGGVEEERTLTTFPIWKMQRAFNFYQSLDVKEKENVDTLLSEVGGQEYMQTEITFKLVRNNFKVQVA
ncbi:MAG: glutathione S-transferase [Myxococcales bacterium]|nr:glutathione S-transferase [Myxococcales bacterium]|tara:strand:- start:1547 stop:2641 length:1095 start_codon:yes stop_codon:yes gene_type:complete